MKEIKLVELCKGRVRGMRGPVKDGMLATGSFTGPSKVFFMEDLNGIRRNTDSGLQANRS
jgi:hypothetical protein